MCDGGIFSHYILRHIRGSILHKSKAGRYRTVRVADGPITARYRCIKNASRDISVLMKQGFGSTKHFFLFLHGIIYCGYSLEAHLCCDRKMSVLFG